MKKIYGKKALTGIEQVMILVLILLTLGAVFMAMYKGDILTKIRNLPSYGQSSSGGDDEIIDPYIESEFCPIKVGELQTEGVLFKWERILFCSNNYLNEPGCGFKMSSGLKIRKDIIQSIDFTKERNPWTENWEDLIGSFINRRILFLDNVFYKTADNNVLVGSGKAVRLIDIDLILNNLENAWILPNGDICRESLVELEVKEPAKIVGTQEFIIKEGDSLESVVKMWGTSKEELLSINPTLDLENYWKVGLKIEVPVYE